MGLSATSCQVAKVGESLPGVMQTITLTACHAAARHRLVSRPRQAAEDDKYWALATLLEPETTTHLRRHPLRLELKTQTDSSSKMRFSLTLSALIALAMAPLIMGAAVENRGMSQYTF
ncbi:hypothetical protein H0H81_011469 [Sphagnurus paluster]|uniref:Uncharacterized protein n=1 Tax=Sphagnurus paluster TaxID=117069 RepID=A0A9P7FNU7_9AGAR|nr:hypothetical protein H0H81_011469 [Sphagnurus paluster]